MNQVDTGVSPVSRYTRLPMHFEENQGQADPAVRYIARGHGYQVFLTSEEAVLNLERSECGKGNDGCSKADGSIDSNRTRSGRLRFKLHNNNNSTESSSLRATGKLKTISNYFIGNDPEKWHTSIPNYSRVEYGGVYPGVDLVFYGSQQSLEYDFVVSPGTDPGQISLSIEGADGIELDAGGDIVLQVAGEKVYHRSPVIYQDGGQEGGQTGGSGRRNVKGRYVLKGGNEIGFEVEAYDKTRPLIIDPVIDYSTFFGGIGTDEAYAVAVDSEGSTYVTGSTYSNNFNTLAPLQSSNRGGKYEAYVSKINPDGTGLVYSTYLGGTSEDVGRGIAVDSFGNAYVAGITNSQDFNVVNAFQPTITGLTEDAFVTKINAAGNQLIFSTYLGGSNIDQAFAIALDSNSNIYVAGSTTSTDFKTKNPLQPSLGGSTDAFVSKIKADGSGLEFSTYYGGAGFDEAYAITLDPSARAYIAGTTASTNLTMVNPQQAQNSGGSDAFVARLNPAGSALEYATYLGGTAVDVAQGIALDQGLNIYIAGHTFSSDYPLAGPLQSVNRGNADAFITKINASGNALLYSTFLRDSGGNFARGIKVDSGNNAFITGRTISTDFNVSNALQPANKGDFDAFIARISPSGSQLVYSTYLGGSSDDLGNAIAIDGSGNAFVVGNTRSTDFKTQTPLQPTNKGGVDGFVTKINAAGNSLLYSTYLGGSGEDLGTSIAIDSAGNAYITGYTSSADFVTQSPIQGISRGGLEVFVTKIFADASDIAFNTYFGGNGSDTGDSIAVDSIGNCYVAGETTSTNLPTRNPVQGTNRGSLDAFVAKFNANGSNIVFSTYLGGQFGDAARGVAVDPAGNIFVVGTTFSEDFPTLSPFQALNRGSGDAFITRINQSGTALVYSSFLGGAGTDEADSVVVDAGGSAYITGNTSSGDFNTKNPLQVNNRGGQDAFVAKVEPLGAGLVYSTYLGGRRTDVGNGIAIDGQGNAYITGSTSSSDFNTLNPLQAAYGGGEKDAFITKINQQGSALVYSTFFGGILTDSANSIAVDSSGSCYITGVTNSVDLPVRNPLQGENRGGNEAFITKLNPQGSSVVYSTYLGGSNDDRGAGIAVDNLGVAYVTGSTASPDFNIQFPLLGYGGGTDVFVARIISEPLLTISPGTIELQPNATGTFTLTTSAAQAASFAVTLASSNPSIVSVSPSVTINGGTTSSSFNVTALALGGPVTITARMPQDQGGGTATATVNVVSSSRILRALPQRVAGGGLLTMPFELVSQGNESRLSFSVSFDPSLLINPQFTLGGDATSATLNVVSSQAAQGRYGISIILPQGLTFSTGTRQVLVLSAVVVSGSLAVSTPVNFVDQPTLKRVADGTGQALAATYTSADVAISVGYEGDVAPRPNGSNGTVSIADWVQTGRFAAGFDTVNPGNEFQRADTAPRASLGNGAISIADWVQTGRYAAGLDPVVPAGGPTGPPALASNVLSFNQPNEAEQSRQIRIVDTTGIRGQQVTLTVESSFTGNENALGFTVNYDPAQMVFVSAAAGADTTTATLNTNPNFAQQGRVGIAMAMPAGATIAAGTRKIATLTFSLPLSASGETLLITFGDQPVVREVVSVLAEVLTVNWIQGTLTVPRPLANLSAASFLGAELASESIVAAFGNGLATSTLNSETRPLPTVLGGTTVSVKDSAGVSRPAPLFFVSSGQINYQVPPGTASGSAIVTITSGAGVVSAAVINVTPVAPAIFSADSSGKGLAAALALRIKADGSQIYEPVVFYDAPTQKFVAVPIDLGPPTDKVLLLGFGTAIRGLSNPAAATAKIGGANAVIEFIGPQPDFVGLDQTNVLIPRSLIGRGLVDFVMTIDGKLTNTVSVVIK
ncbi:MAG: SBBP repeat-containing protein [Acidobacteria bacterium]|nr:SBBP repeat-containing protein [Acidobacteriota bacterium]